MVEIHPEYPKTQDALGLSWMTCYFNFALRSGRVPLDWQIGVLDPLFKQEDQSTGAPALGKGVTLFSVPG